MNVGSSFGGAQMNAMFQSLLTLSAALAALSIFRSPRKHKISTTMCARNILQPREGPEVA